MTKIKSLVNSITVKATMNRFGSPIDVVDKHFGATAIGTGVVLPVERIQIEERVSNFVSNFCQNYEFIRTPELIDINYSKSIISYEYIPAQTLDEAIKHSSVPIMAIKELFEFLYAVSSVMDTQAKELFVGLEDISKQCESAQLQYKFGKTLNFELSSLRSLCLGDVSLSNILFSKNKLYLIDFEFARIFESSFDSAQIYSQLNVFFPGLIGLEQVSEHMHRDSFRKWVSLFTSYYQRKVATNV